MEETLISWNITNWITVLLMVGIGVLVFHMVGGAVRKARASKGG